MKNGDNAHLSNLTSDSSGQMADTAPSRPAPALEHPMDEYQPIRVGTTKPIPEIRRGEHRRARWGRWALLAAVLLYFRAAAQIS
jgi:hypothetical protein